jgi:hypothetical protein
VVIRAAGRGTVAETGSVTLSLSALPDLSIGLVLHAHVDRVGVLVRHWSHRDRWRARRASKADVRTVAVRLGNGGAAITLDHRLALKAPLGI